MKKINFTALIFSTILIFTLSCTNTDGSEELMVSENQNKVMSFEDYVKYISQDYSAGRVIIENVASMDFQTYSVHYSDNLSKENFNENKKFRIISDGQEISNLKSSSSLKNNFGKTINYSISTESIKKSSSSNTIYIPEMLDASISTSDLRVGSVVSWNVDSNNENGLVLWYEYSPFNQDVYSIVDENMDRLVGGFTVPDEGGTYTITAQDLAHLPSNAYINFNITRAGMDINETGSGSTSVTGMTSNTKEIMVIK